MKNVITILLLLLTATCAASNRYVSNTGSDAANGLTPATAWQTLTKVNAFEAAPGDSVLFNAGDTFYGTVNCNYNGVTYDQFGTGAKPIITGLTSVSGWVNLGSNIWEAPVTNGSTSCNIVILNGVSTPMGKWPNYEPVKGGYATYTSFVKGASITDPTLTDSPNWSGGDLIIRQVDWVITKRKITTQSGTTLNFTGGSTDYMTLNYGYMVSNHPATLDIAGEWYYDINTKKIKMYYVGKPPAIKVSTVPVLINIIGAPSGGIKQNISINNISLIGCDSVLITTQWTNRLKVDNCDFLYAGINAIDLKYEVNFSLTNSKIKYINSCGITQHPSYVNTNGVTIANNNISCVGINENMIGSDITYYIGALQTAVCVLASNTTISNNIIDSCGYNGISILAQRTNFLCKRNVVSNFCLKKNDGGGIYNGGVRNDTLRFSNFKIIENIVFNSGVAGFGTTNSTNGHARGIYLDATSDDVVVNGNTLFNCWEGIYISCAKRDTITYNTVYNCGLYKPSAPQAYAGAFASADYLPVSSLYPTPRTKDNVVTDNIFFAKLSAQLMYWAYNKVTVTGDTKDTIGIMDRNYWINTGDQTHLIGFNRGDLAQYYTLPAWKTSRPYYDANSFSTPLTTPVITELKADTYLRFEYNPTLSPITINFLGQRWMDAKGVNYDNSITLQPFTSAPLIANGSSPNTTTPSKNIEHGK